MAKTYRLRIATAAATTVTGNVDVTLTSAQLAQVPTIPGDIARPLEGRTEAQSWSVRMLSSAIIGDIADANGRLDLGGRLCDWAEATDGVTYTVLWTGRLTGLSSPDPATFEATFESERWVERRATIFNNSNTSQLFPPGPRSAFTGNHFGAAAVGTSMRVVQVDGTDAVRLAWQGLRTPFSNLAVDFLKGDVIRAPSSRTDQGNFTHARLSINGTDREIIAFGEERNTGPANRLHRDGEAPDVWVYWATHGLSLGDVVGDRGQDPCFLYAPTAPPSEALPLHIGGTTGIDPATLLQDIYDGDYGALDESSNPVVVRADTSALVGTTSRAWFRITAPQNMAQWVEENIYRPLLWCPFVNSTGQVVPKSVALPQNITYTSLTTLDATNVTPPYPDWDFQTRDAVTSFQVQSVVYEAAIAPGEEAEGDFPSDGIVESTRDFPPEDHDNISRLGRRSRKVRVPYGMAVGSTFLPRQYFDRVGDGLLYIPALHVRDSVTEVPGDFVELDYDSLKGPNPNTNARTGSTIWQVVKKDRKPGTGFVLELEYAGPYLQKLDAPSITASQNSDDPENSIDVAISGLNAGEGYLLRINRGNGYQHETIGTADETVVVGQCPSNTEITAEVVRTKAGRIRSAPATDAVTTASLSPPTSVSVAITNRSGSLTWVVGEAEFPVMPTLDGADFLSDPLPAGSTQYVFDELEASTSYVFGVKHVDAYGGASTIATDTDTTSTAATLTAPSNLVVRQGRGTAAATVPSHLVRLNTGVELGWALGDSAAGTRVQVATDSGFTAIIADTVVPAGRSFVQMRTKLSQGLVYARVAHVRAGFTTSSWSSTVSAYPTVMLPSAPAQDRFPGGFAALSVSETGAVTLLIGSDDADTTAAYYEVSTSAFPTVTTADSSIAKSTMPNSIATGVTLTYGQTAYATVKFYNPATGFGQTAQDRITKGAADDLDDIADGTTYKRTTLPEKTQISRGGQNLLGPDAGPTQLADPYVYYNGTIADLDLEVGDVVSLSGELRSPAGTSSVRLRLTFKDSGGGTVSTHDSSSVTATSFTRATVENITIPATTTDVSVQSTFISGASRESRRVMFNEGPVALKFVEPPIRGRRETVDDLPDGSTYGRPKGTEMDTGRIKRIYRPTGGLTITAENIQDWGTETLETKEGGTIFTGNKPKVVRDTVSGRDIAGSEILKWGTDTLQTKEGGTVFTGNKPKLVRDTVAGRDVAGSAVLDVDNDEADRVYFPGRSDTVADLEPAEANAETRPPMISAVSLSVVDNDAGNTDDYTVSWAHSSQVSASYDVDIYAFRNGTQVGTDLANVATDDGATFSTSGGDGVTDDHYVELWLLNGSGEVMQGPLRSKTVVASLG